MRRPTASKVRGVIVVSVSLLLLGYCALSCVKASWLQDEPQADDEVLASGEGPEVEISAANLSNIDHGDTLAEVMEGIRQEDFEVTAVFTADGEKLFEHTNYSGDNVQLDVEYVRLMHQYKGIIRLHNHPLACHASFSRNDLKNLANCQAGYGIVVTKNETYVVTPNHEWPPVDELDAFMREHTDLMEVVWPKGYEEELPVTTRELMELVAEQYDFSYYEWNKAKVSSEEIALAILGK